MRTSKLYQKFFSQYGFALRQEKESDGYALFRTRARQRESWSRQLVQLQRQHRGTSDELIRTLDALLFAHLAPRGVIRATAIKLELRFDPWKSVGRSTPAPLLITARPGPCLIAPICQKLSTRTRMIVVESFHRSLSRFGNFTRGSFQERSAPKRNKSEAGLPFSE